MVCVRHCGRRARAAHDRPPRRQGRAAARRPTADESPTRRAARSRWQPDGSPSWPPARSSFSPDTGRLACSVPAEKQAALAELKVGDKVKIYCLPAASSLALERARWSSSTRLGRSTSSTAGSPHSHASFRDSVQGEAGSLTCTTPAGDGREGSRSTSSSATSVQDDVPRLRARVPREGLGKAAYAAGVSSETPAASRPRA